MVDLIKSTCRVCLMEGNKELSIFGNHKSGKYCDLIKEFTGMNVVQNNNLPSGICDTCLSELMVVMKFVTKFRSSTDKIKTSKETMKNNVDCTDEENATFSMISKAIKEEDALYEMYPSDLFFPLMESGNQKQHNSDNKGNELYKIVKSPEFGIKKDMVQCLTCGLLVQNKSAFVVHNRRHTGEKPCKCLECGKCFTQIGSLNDHIKRHHLKQCIEKTGVLADTVKKMRIRGKLGEYRFTCDACGKRFWKKGALTIHLRVHTREKPYKCTFCPKKFAQYSEHLQHTRIHTGERPYACHICQKRFIAHTPLRRHLTVHSDIRNYKCKVCDTAVKSSDSLKKHMLVMHSSEKRHVCELCGAGFAMKYNLKSHVRARHSEKSGICDICKKMFSNLEKHMNTHLGQKPFGCQMCNKRFFRQNGLLAHMAKHQNESANFACTFENCTSAFSKQCKLDFHILKYHTNHTPHVCHYCSKGFYRLADLRKHIKSLHDNCADSINANNINC